MIYDNTINIHDKEYTMQIILKNKDIIKQYRVYSDEQQLVCIVDVNYDIYKEIQTFSYTQVKYYEMVLKDVPFILRLDINGLTGQVETCSIWYYDKLYYIIKVNGVKMKKFYNLMVLTDFIYELMKLF